MENSGTLELSGPLGFPNSWNFKCFPFLIICEDSSNNPQENKQYKSAGCTSWGSTALNEDVIEKLETLLNLLVDATKGASIEMLERYHSSLQCCIHKQRHSHDKGELLKVC